MVGWLVVVSGSAAKMGSVSEVNHTFHKVGAGKSFAFNVSSISGKKTSMAGPFFMDKKVIR